MNVDILCSVNDEGLARRCASVAGERVTTIPVGDSEPAKPAEDEAANLTSSWDGLLERTRQRTRFNCSRRFVDGVRSAEPGQPSGIAALFSTDQPQALVVGKLDLNDTWQGVGPLSRILPGLPTLEIAHSALVTDSSSEAVEAAVGYLAKLLRSDVAKRLQVKNLLVDSALHAAFDRCLDGGCRILRRPEVRFRRRLRDPETGEPVQVNSSKTRQGLRRKQRNLKKELGGDVEFLKVTRPDQTDEFLRDAAEIVAKTYQAAIDVGVRDDAPMREFLHKLATEGTLRGYLFRGNGQAIAYVLGDVENCTFNLWATSFLPEYGRFSPGIVLLDQVFEELTSEGVELFDFGHGEAAYKQQLGNEKLEEETLSIYAPGPVPLTAFLLHRGSLSLQSALRDALNRSGGLQKLRKIWRDLLRRSGSS